MVVIPPHNLGPNSGKWGTIITRLLQQLEDRSNHAVQTAERAVKSNASVMDAVQQTNTQIAETQNDLANNRRIAAAPENISTTTVGVWDALGNPVSSIEISWDAVTVDTHGDNLNISSYEVWWKTGAAVYLPGLKGDPTDLIDSSYYKRLTSTPGLSLTTNVDSNTLYSFAVRAVTANGINGVFSLASDITSDASVGTIVAPTKPTVSQTVGVVSVMWDGNLTSGGLPNYFRYVKVLQSTSSTGTYVDTGQTLSGAGGIAISGHIDGQAYYYKLQAVDSTGNASGLSVASDSITPEGVDLSGLEADISSAQSDAAAALSAANTAQTAADSAQSDADAASAAAASAAGIANSKAVVLYQTTAPGSTYQNSLTLWIDTTSGANTPKRWNGSTWVAVTDKVATDAAQAAATANTAAGTAQTAANTAQTTANNAVSAASAAQSTADTAKTNAATAQTAANNAASAASAANQAALDAAGIANSKGKVIIQSAAPATADQLPQNLWIDTTNGANTPKRWSGSAWVIVTDKAATDAATAAATAKTAADNAAADAATAQSAANAAQTAANAAQSTANAAQTTANGKNTVYYASSAPTGGTYKVNDIWFDTANGNRINKWSGSAWTTAQLGSGAIANGAVTATQIATAVNTAITNAQTTATNAATAASTADGKAVTAQNTANAAQTAASDAQSDADAASAAAASAAGIANSKGKVLIQSTAPAAADQLAQNLWIDTTSGANTPKRWSGSAWVAVTDKAATDAATAAVAAQSTADTAKANAATAQAKADSAYNNAATAQTTATNAANAAAAASSDAADAQTTANTAVSNAATAQSAADAANAAAADAAGIANGKGKVIFSNTAPTGTDAAATTLWIDTTGGANTPKRWVSGTTWSVVTDKAATDAASAAAAANTAAGNAQTTANTAVTNAATAQSAANAAQAKADSAFINAGNAQTTANGKNVVTYATTGASSGTPGTRAGDVWFQQSGGVVLGQWVWSGTAWVQQTLSNAVLSSIDAGKITSGSISAARIAANTITSAMIAANTIVAADIAAHVITANEMVVGTITAASGIIADAAITTAKIANLAVTDAQIANGTITNASIANIDAGKITTGSIAAARIAAGTITSTMIAANTIIAGDIAAGTITATEIAANTITAAKIAAGTITANEIASGTITTAKLNATAIDGMTVTGATLQTSSAVNSGVKFDDNGISAYDDLGNRTVWIDADTGTLNATNGVFTGVINATGGAIAGILNMGIQGTTVIGTLPTSSDSWGFVFPGGMYTYANFSNGGVITQYTMASLTSGVLRAVAVDGPSGNKTDTVFGYNGVTMTSKPSGGTSLVVGQFTVSSQDLSISVFGKNSLKLAGGPGGSGSGNVVLDNTGVNINAPLRISNWPVIGSSLTLTTPLAVDSGGTGVTSLASLKTSLTDDTGWVAATFPSGMHSFDEGPNKVYWRVINGVAYWKGLVGKVGGGNFSTAQEAMIVLPPAARPSGSLQFPGVTAGTQGSGQVVSVYVNGGAGDYIYHLLTPTSPGTYISMTGIAYPVP